MQNVPIKKTGSENEDFLVCTFRNVFRTQSTSMMDQYPEGRVSLPCPFSKIEKSALIHEKNALVFSIYGLNFSFRVKIFSLGAFLSCVADEMFIEVTLYLEPSPVLKNSWLCPQK